MKIEDDLKNNYVTKPDTTSKLNNQKKSRTDEFPGNPPEYGRSASNHHFHIVAEPGDSVEPEDSDGLYEDHKEYRI